MTGRAHKLFLFALLGLVLVTGCRKKKESTVTPQSQAPTVSAPEETPAAGSTEAKPSTPEPSASTPATTTPAGTASEPATVTTSKPKPKPKAPKTARQKPPAQSTTTTSTSQPAAKPAAGEPTPPAATATTPPAATNNNAGQTQTGAKVVVPEGGDTPTSGQISAPGSNDDAHSRQNIEQLLQSTDTNLRSITRALTNDERAMIEQIRNYMTQARSASTDGDLIRANNLALKAHLLSDELVKR